MLKAELGVHINEVLDKEKQVLKDAEMMKSNVEKSGNYDKISSIHLGSTDFEKYIMLIKIADCVAKGQKIYNRQAILKETLVNAAKKAN